MKIKYIFGLALATTLFASCSEDMLDSINEREASKTADKVAAKFQLTDAEVATAYSTVNGSYAWYVSSYTEQLFGTGNNQLKNAELRNANETAASTTFNNEWNATYSNLYNINQMIQKCSEGGINSDQTDILVKAESEACKADPASGTVNCKFVGVAVALNEITYSQDKSLLMMAYQKYRESMKD